jgi:cbb3-type cytochrome oxidase subunit 3
MDPTAVREVSLILLLALLYAGVLFALKATRRSQR